MSMGRVSYAGLGRALNLKAMTSRERVSMTKHEQLPRTGIDVMREFYEKHPFTHTPRREKGRASRVTTWGPVGPRGTSISLAFIDPFDARGMRPLHGRGDHFGRRALHMNVWRTRTGRVLARFWSRSSDVDSESHELAAIRIATEEIAVALADNEHLIPECLRDAYESWVLSELPFIY